MISKFIQDNLVAVVTAAVVGGVAIGYGLATLFKKDTEEKVTKVIVKAKPKTEEVVVEESVEETEVVVKEENTEVYNDLENSEPLETVTSDLCSATVEPIPVNGEPDRKSSRRTEETDQFSSSRKVRDREKESGAEDNSVPEIKPTLVSFEIIGGDDVQRAESHIQFDNNQTNGESSS